MSRTPDGAPQAEMNGLSSAQVAAFLRRNPSFLGDFLRQHPQALERIAPEPAERPDGVVDLQTFMVSRLRAEVRRLTARMTEVVQTSRSNLSAQALVHESALSLLEATSLEELIDVVTADLAMMLSVDVATLCVETDEAPTPPARTPGVYLLEAGAVDQILGRNVDYRLDSRIVGHPALFGHAAGLVRSQALLRVHVGRDAPEGLLALGTRDEAHFDASQGAELLCFLARILGGAIRQWMKAPKAA